MTDENQIEWKPDVKESFDKMIGKIPWAMRKIAKDKVSKKAISLVKEDGRTLIEEKDMVDAFFEATPFGFHGPMTLDMEEFGIDYKKYGHPIDYMSQFKTKKD